MPTLAVYLLGTLGVSYHLANGLQTAAMGWGVVTSRAALEGLESSVIVVFSCSSRRLERASVIVVFLVPLAMAWSAIYGHGADAGAAYP